jgi:AcrR family transcriptional regulator
MDLEPLTAERRRQQTRAYLLRAAARVFEERGFYGATLDEVAAVAGFTKGAVYSNFKNKEDLFMALFQANYEEQMDVLRETLQASEIPPQARLSDFVTMLQEEGDRVGTNFGLLYQEFWLYAVRNPTARAQLIQIENENVRAIGEILQSERVRLGFEPLESPDRIARIITIIFNGIGMQRVLQPELADDALIETAISFVARGLDAGATG